METKIHYNSDQAATYRTDVKGWVASDGRYYGEDERTARYAGCTVRPCASCDNEVDKSRVYCRSCEARRDMDKFAGFPVEVWDGKTPLCLFNSETYFFGDDVLDYLADIDPSEEVRICKCKPNHLGLISDDNWCDDLPEDGELPDAVFLAMQALNDAIKEAGPVSWYEDKIAIDVSELRSRIAAKQK